MVLLKIFRLQFQDLLNAKQLRDEAFSRFWLGFSGQPVPPPDQLVGSAALVPPLLALATGDVLEIGPGSGGHLRYFNRNPDIYRMYGAEPNVGLHEELRKQAALAGLADRYQVFDCGAEMNSLVPKLNKEGLLSNESHGQYGENIFDTIICIRVLCSISQPIETIANLHRLLKPGGQLLIVEHVVSPWDSGNGSVIARAMQLLYHALGWVFFMGDCHMDRDTSQLLTEAARPVGGWKKVDIKQHFWWAPLTYISGQLEK